jgi:hypothetical protein
MEHLALEHATNHKIANCMANYAVLSQADNARIGKEEPQSVYERLSGNAKNYADEQLFYIFVEKRDWAQAYDAFLTQRAEILAERLNARGSGHGPAVEVFLNVTVVSIFPYS